MWTCTATEFVDNALSAVGHSLFNHVYGEDAQEPKVWTAAANLESHELQFKTSELYKSWCTAAQAVRSDASAQALPTVLRQFINDDVKVDWENYPKGDVQFNVRQREEETTTIDIGVRGAERSSMTTNFASKALDEDLVQIDNELYNLGDEPGIKVHSEFHQKFKEFCESRQDFFDNLVKKVQDLRKSGSHDDKVIRINLSGHAFGGAYAVLTAFYMSRMQFFAKIPDVEIRVYTWGSPMVGNAAFVQAYNNENITETKRMFNGADPLPFTPAKKTSPFTSFWRKLPFVPKGGPEVTNVAAEEVPAEDASSQASEAYEHVGEKIYMESAAAGFRNGFSFEQLSKFQFMASNDILYYYRNLETVFDADFTELTDRKAFELLLAQTAKAVFQGAINLGAKVADKFLNTGELISSCVDGFSSLMGCKNAADNEMTEKQLYFAILQDSTAKAATAATGAFAVAKNNAKSIDKSFKNIFKVAKNNAKSINMGIKDILKGFNRILNVEHLLTEVRDDIKTLRIGQHKLCTTLNCVEKTLCTTLNGVEKNIVTCVDGLRQELGSNAQAAENRLIDEITQLKKQNDDLNTMWQTQLDKEKETNQRLISEREELKDEWRRQREELLRDADEVRRDRDRLREQNQKLIADRHERDAKLSDKNQKLLTANKILLKSLREQINENEQFHTAYETLNTNYYTVPNNVLLGQMSKGITASERGTLNLSALRNRREARKKWLHSY